MSSLKTLKDIVDLINEKKDPIINMYLGDTNDSLFDVDERENVSLEALSTRGKARIYARKIESSSIKNEYEISINKVLEKEPSLEFIIYNTKTGVATSKRYKKLDNAIELIDATITANNGVIDEIIANTAIYSFDNLRQAVPHYNYEQIPVQVISALLGTALRTTDIEPDHKDSFFSDSKKIGGAISLRARVTESDNVYDDTIYPYTATVNPVLFAYNEYLSGCLQPSILFSTVDEVRKNNTIF